MQAEINGENKAPTAPKKKRGMIVLAIIAVLGLLGGGWWWYTLRTTLTTDNAKVTGDIVDMSARAAGLLTEITVQEGEQVKAGQVIARLDDNQAKINLAQAEAALEIAQANTGKLPTDVASAKSGLAKAQELLASSQAQAKAYAVTAQDAKRQLEKTQALYQQGAVSRESLDQIMTKYEAAQANADAYSATAASAQAAVVDAQAKMDALNNTGAVTYSAQLKQAQAVYDNAKLALDNTIVKAQIDGTVVRIAGQVGENVTAGQTLITVSNLQQVWVTANIQEKQVGRIMIGQAVDVRLDAYPGKVFAGTVKEIGDATQSTFALIPTENTSGNFTKVSQRFPVKIKLTDSKVMLKPGMSAVVKIHT